MKKASIALCAFFFSLHTVVTGLTCWVGWEGEGFYREAAASFSKETGVEIEILHFPKIEEKLDFSLKTNELPDIALVKDTYTGNLVASGRALRIPREDLAEFTGLKDSHLQAYTFQDRLVGIPYYADAQVAFLNVELLEEAGIEVPEELDFDQFAKIHEKLRETVPHPIAFDFTSPYIMYPYMFPRAGEGDSSKPVVDLQGRVSTVTSLKRYFDLGVVSRLERGAMNKLFLEGKVGIMLQGSYLARKFAAEGITFRMLPLPAFEGERISGLIDSKGFAFFHEETYEQAFEFVKYLLAASEDFYLANYKYPLSGRIEGLSQLEKVIAKGRFMENYPGYEATYFQAVQLALQAIYADKLSVEAALAGAQVYINSSF